MATITLLLNFGLTALVTLQVANMAFMCRVYFDRITQGYRLQMYVLPNFVAVEYKQSKDIR